MIKQQNVRKKKFNNFMLQRFVIVLEFVYYLYRDLIFNFNCRRK